MDKVNSLIERVRFFAVDKKFKHYKWYVKYHLEIVERIAFELLPIYKNANKEVVLAIVWLHDLEKILDMRNFDETETKIREIMSELDFDESFTDIVIDYIKLFEKSTEVDLRNAPIEVKIASSSDGAAHMFGPFNAIWFYENPDKKIDELMLGNISKLNNDWERKIVLDEIKDSLLERRRFTTENYGELPERFLVK